MVTKKKKTTKKLSKKKKTKVVKKRIRKPKIDLTPIVNGKGNRRMWNLKQKRYMYDEYYNTPDGIKGEVLLRYNITTAHLALWKKEFEQAEITKKQAELEAKTVLFVSGKYDPE